MCNLLLVYVVHFFFNRYNEEKNDDDHNVKEDNYLFKKTLVLLSGRKQNLADGGKINNS